MWIEDTIICNDCGSEVTLYTDGRSAYGLTGQIGPKGTIGEADTVEVWRDGQSLVLSCPVYIDWDGTFRCGNELRYTGKGTASFTNTALLMDDVSEPILDEAP